MGEIQWWVPITLLHALTGLLTEASRGAGREQGDTLEVKVGRLMASTAVTDPQVRLCTTREEVLEAGREAWSLFPLEVTPPSIAHDRRTMGTAGALANAIRSLQARGY